MSHFKEEKKLKKQRVDNGDDDKMKVDDLVDQITYKYSN